MRPQVDLGWAGGKDVEKMVHKTCSSNYCQNHPGTMMMRCPHKAWLMLALLGAWGAGRVGVDPGAQPLGPGHRKDVISQWEAVFPNIWRKPVCNRRGMKQRERKLGVSKENPRALILGSILKPWFLQLFYAALSTSQASFLAT